MRNECKKLKSNFIEKEIEKRLETIFKRSLGRRIRRKGRGEKCKKKKIDEMGLHLTQRILNEVKDMFELLSLMSLPLRLDLWNKEDLGNTGILKEKNLKKDRQVKEDDGQVQIEVRIEGDHLQKDNQLNEKVLRVGLSQRIKLEKRENPSI